MMAQIQGASGQVSIVPHSNHLPPEEVSTLERIQERVLWLSTRMIDYANRERENLDGLKVGGHQASKIGRAHV